MELRAGEVVVSDDGSDRSAIVGERQHGRGASGLSWKECTK